MDPGRNNKKRNNEYALRRAAAGSGGPEQNGTKGTRDELTAPRAAKEGGIRQPPPHRRFVRTARFVQAEAGDRTDAVLARARRLAASLARPAAHDAVQIGSDHPHLSEPHTAAHDAGLTEDLDGVCGESHRTPATVHVEPGRVILCGRHPNENATLFQSGQALASP